MTGGKGAGGDAVEKIKELQRNDPAAKEKWIEYCNTEGGGKRDPALHDAKFIQVFLSKYKGGGSMGGGGPPTKLARMGASMGGGGKKEQLVNRIKAYQRADEGQKEAWWEFAHREVDPLLSEEFF